MSRRTTSKVWAPRPCVAVGAGIPPPATLPSSAFWHRWALLSFGLVFGLVAGCGPQRACDQSPGRRGQVDFPGDRGEFDAALVGLVDDVFQFAWGSCQPVHVRDQ